MIEQRILELLTRKLAGEISSDELAELKELMSDFNEAAQIQEVADEIWTHDREPVNALSQYEKHVERYDHGFLAPEVEEMLPAHHSRLSQIQNYRPLIVTVFGVVALAVLSYLFFIHDRPKRYQLIKINTAMGVRKRVILRDSSVAWLNGGSQLVYPTVPDKAQRLMILRGEGYFEIAGDARRPFLLKTATCNITTVGPATVNVRVYPGDSIATVTLLSGSSVWQQTGGSQQSIDLQAKEKLQLISGSLTISPLPGAMINGQSLIPEVAWKDNQLVFPDEPLSEIAKTMERWFGVTVVVDQSVATWRFGGNVDGSNLEQTLISIQQKLPVQYRIDDKTVTLSKK